MIKWLIKSGIFLQLILLIVFILAFWVPAFLSPKSAIISEFDGPVYTFFVQLFSHSYLLQVIIALALLIVQAFGLTLVLQINGLVHRSNIFPAFPVVIGYSWNPDFLTLHPFLFSGILLIAALYFLMRLYGKQAAYREVFSATFSISLASLFFFPLIYMLILVWTAFITIRITEWREYVITLIAFILPYLYYASGLFWNSNFMQGSTQFFNSIFRFSLPQPIGMVNTIWLLACVFIIVVTALAILLGLNDKLLNIRKKSWVIGNMLMVSLLPIIAVGFPLLNANYIFIIPSAYFITAIVVYSKQSLYVDILLLGVFLLYLSLRFYTIF